LAEITTPGPVSIDNAQLLAQSIQSVFAVEQMSIGSGSSAGIHLAGTLLTDSRRAYHMIEQECGRLGYMALLRQKAGRALVIALPRAAPTAHPRDRLAVLWLALTAVSMLLANGLSQAPSLEWLLQNPLAGLPFTVGLLGILLAHEAGHYLVARRLGIAASLPHFIPMPLSLFGTMGAIIRVRSPMRDRRQVLAMGAAGPLAGLVIAVPILILGLMRSQVAEIMPTTGTFVEGNSLLYAGLKRLIFGEFLPSGGRDVFLHPLAFAGWAGLLLTGLNLIPAGQFDGGHVAYALLGERARWLSRLAVFATVALGLLWSGWYIWSVLLLVLGQRHAEPLDNVTSLSGHEKGVAVGVLLLFLALFAPIPMTFL